MHCNDHNIIALRPMHNPQHPAAKFGYRLKRSRAIRVMRISFDKLRRAYRRLDPIEANIADRDSFSRMLGQKDQASPVTDRGLTAIVSARSALSRPSVPSSSASISRE